MEALMKTTQSLEVKEKQEVAAKEETTVPARYFVPSTDIFETEDALIVAMEVPGVEKKNVAVTLENNVLRVEGRIDFSKYEGLEPLYTEYGVGHFTRAFTLSNAVDQQKINAKVDEGVLTLTLMKAKQAQMRRIEIK